MTGHDRSRPTLPDSREQPLPTTEKALTAVADRMLPDRNWYRRAD
jgi:hypothetical protein